MVPDYYAMLGLDPQADRATIEAALARCQPAWSSGTRNPKNKHTYQSYLDQIPALPQARRDPGRRSPRPAARRHRLGHAPADPRGARAPPPPQPLRCTGVAPRRPDGRDRRPRRRRASAVDAEEPGHGREDRLARSG